MGDSAENQKKPENEKKPGKQKKAGKEKKPGFFKGVKAEFKKITWPDRNETIKQSVAVVAISVVLGVIIAILDFAFQNGVNFLTSL